MNQTYHVHWGVILQLGLVVVLLVVLLALHLSHSHVVNQQRIVLDAAEANMVASGLLVSLFILDLKDERHLASSIRSDIPSALDNMQYAWYIARWSLRS